MDSRFRGNDDTDTDSAGAGAGAGADTVIPAKAGIQ